MRFGTERGEEGRDKEVMRRKGERGEEKRGRGGQEEIKLGGD